MGGTITHLVIADKIIKKLPEGAISDTGMFYAGALAPDAIHARKGYIRAMKKHTHLRTDIWDRDFIKPESRQLFHERLIEFIDSNNNKTGHLRDAYLGYVSHLLSDEVFVITARQKLVDKLAGEEIGQREREFIPKFAHDVHSNDNILSVNYPRLFEVRKILETVEPFEIHGYVTTDEIERSRCWVISTFLADNRSIGEPVYITRENISEYINQSVQYSIDYMREHHLIP